MGFVGISQDRRKDESLRRFVSNISQASYLGPHETRINTGYFDERLIDVERRIDLEPEKAREIVYDVFGEEFLIGVASPLVSRLEKQFGYELNDNSFGEIPAELNEDLAKDITSKLPDACAKRTSWSDVIAGLLQYNFSFEDGVMKWDNETSYVPNAVSKIADSRFFRLRNAGISKRFRKLVDLGRKYIEKEVGFKIDSVDLSGCPFEKPFDTKLELDSLVDTLIGQGVRPIDAEVIASNFEDVVEGKSPEVKSKNVVYHISDVYGNNRVIKFVKDKKEAEAECFANFHFSQHPILRRYVPRGFIDKPLEVILGDDLRYVTIQEDVSETKSKNLDDVLISGSKDEVIDYLENWMKVLARFHVYGTEIADRYDNNNPALRLTKEKDEDRVRNIEHDPILRSDVRAEVIEDKLEYIHQDIRSENRLGNYAIDWGHSGRGNPLLDVARVLLDVDVKKKLSFDEDFYKHFIGIYLDEKSRISRKSMRDVDSAYLEFKKLGLIYMQSQSAYLISKGKDCSPKEKETISYMDITGKNFEKCFVSRNSVIVRGDKPDCVVYYLPVDDLRLAA